MDTQNTTTPIVQNISIVEVGSDELSIQNIFYLILGGLGGLCNGLTLIVFLRKSKK